RGHEAHELVVAVGQPTGQKRAEKTSDVNPAIKDLETGIARAGLSTAEELPGVVDVRVLGAIGEIEMAHDVDMAATTAAAMRNGVWLRPFGRLIYAMPPFISTDDEVAQIARAMVAAGKAHKP